MQNSIEKYGDDLVCVGFRYDISVKRKLKTVKFENGTYTLATEFRKIFIEENNNYLYLVKRVLFRVCPKIPVPVIARRFLPKQSP